MDICITPSERRPKPYPWEEETWIGEAMRDPGHIDAALDALHIGNRPHVMADLVEEIGRVVTVFPEDFAPFGEHRPPRPEVRSSMFDAIRQWLSGLKVVEEESIVVTREVPLCVFNCPDVHKAQTIFAESRTTGGTAGWSIEVLGTGFGSDVTVSVSQTNKFSASAAERKLVFAPLRIRVVKAALYKREVLQERFLRSEVAESEARDANGVRSVDATEWQTLVGNGHTVERFDLSKDTGKGVTTYERGYELSGTFEAKIGLDAFKLKSTVRAKCTAEQSATLTFALPAGRKYELRAPAAMAGFYFV